MRAAARSEIVVLVPVLRRALDRLVRRAAPREACAFLIGDTTGSRHLLCSAVTIRNTHRSRHSFGIDARALTQLPAPPLALFHSHAHAQMLSPADLKIFDRMPQLRFQLIGISGPSGLRFRAFNRINHEIEIASQ